MIMKNRIIAAYLFAPLTPTLYIVALNLFGDSVSSMKAAIFMSMFSLPLSYMSCVICVPIILYLLRKSNLLSLWIMVACGFVMGIIFWYLIGFLITDLLDSKNDYVPSLLGVFWGGVFGVSVALPFGLIAGIPWKASH